jgi:AcrR family transcriptional regulator
MNQPKPITLRKQQKNYTRQRLLEVSRKLFVKKGPQATGIDDIAKAAGTSRATVYTHFAGKQDIIRELLTEMWDTALNLYRTFDNLPDWSRASIAGWLGQVFDAWEEYGASTNIVLREMPSEVNAEFQSLLEDHVAALTRTSEKWAHFDRGEAMRRAYLLILQLQRGLTAVHFGGWSVDRDALLNTFTEIWMSTLQPPARQENPVRSVEEN